MTKAPSTRAEHDLKALEDMARSSPTGISRYDIHLYVTYYSKTGTTRLWGLNGKRLKRSEALRYLEAGKTY